MPGKTPSGLFSTGLIDNIFPDHRDRVTASILERMIDLMATEGGLVIDSLADTDLQIVDAGGGKINVKAGVAYDKFGQRIYIAADDSASGLYVGTVDLSSPIDLSTNKNIKIDIDDTGAVQIDCSGATPASTTIDEIVATINAAGFGTIAFRTDTAGNPSVTGSYIMLKSNTIGGSSEVEFVAPSANDATEEIFGLSEAGYPHTYVGGGGYTIPDDSTDYDVIIEYLSVESAVGNFESGYPTGSDTEYTLRDDSYKVTVQLSSVGPVSDDAQHELLLAIISNTGGILTITDNRDQIMLRLTGQKDTDATPPAAPVLVSLTAGTIPDTGIGGELTMGYIIPRWEAVADPSGIREYILQLVLTEQNGGKVSDADPIEYTLQGFDHSASELQMKIERPLGDKYDVYVGAKDNSLSQNISPFTNMGNIQVGGTEITTMPAITLKSITDGVLVDWADAPIDIMRYEYCYSEGSPAGRPRWEGSKSHTTRNSEFTITAAPGLEVQVRVRIRHLNMTLSNEESGQAIAGGTVIGRNEKVIPADGLSVLATDDGKTARFLKNVFLPNPATIVRLAVDVESLTLNSSSRGMIRIYRSNEEAGSVNITFAVAGMHEVELSAKFTAGWIVVDAFDSDESGGNQAAFTALLAIVYAEGQVSS